jgi:hypothetical protein
MRKGREEKNVDKGKKRGKEGKKSTLNNNNEKRANKQLRARYIYIIRGV